MMLEDIKTKVFNSIEEMKNYYDEETNTYNFRGKNTIEKIILNFDLNIESDIVAYDIRATSITAKNIHARDIMVWEINACDIKAININAGVIQARDIDGLHIKSMNIYARDIKVYGFTTVNIYARDIIYITRCIAYGDFKCNSIKCELPRPSHYTFYGKLEVTKNDK